MLNRVLGIALLLILCHGSAEALHEVAAVPSVRVQPYEAAIKGFSSICRSNIVRMVLSEWGGADVVGEIKRIRPDMVLAIGSDALSLVKGIKNLPIVYLMVVNPQKILLGEKNITGVSMNISPDKQLKALLNAMPHTKRIGLVYDPRRTGPFVMEAQRAAAQMGVTLAAKALYSAKDVPSFIAEMKNSIDVFWMLPDTTVITPETIEFLLLFSLENNIPLLTFSEKYLEMGAFMSTGIDPFDMGVQAGEIANRVLLQKGIGPWEQVHARRMVISTNLMIAEKLGIRLNVAGISGMDLSEKIIKSTLTID